MTTENESIDECNQPFRDCVFQYILDMRYQINILIDRIIRFASN
jgi:hypothetical protein